MAREYQKRLWVQAHAALLLNQFRAYGINPWGIAALEYFYVFLHGSFSSYYVNIPGHQILCNPALPGGAVIETSDAPRSSWSALPCSWRLFRSWDSPIEFPTLLDVSSGHAHVTLLQLFIIKCSLNQCRWSSTNARGHSTAAAIWRGPYQSRNQLAWSSKQYSSIFAHHRGHCQKPTYSLVENTQLENS